jgi:uncharacterized membrane protein
MNRLLMLLLLVLVVIGVTVIAATAPDLPARMATHFGARGQANGWSSRGTYVAVMILLVAGLPLGLVALVVRMPRAGACALKLEQRDYWLAPARRERTLERLRAYASVAGCLLVVFLTAMHLIVVDANASARPALPTAAFIAVMLGFAVAMIAWAIAFSHGFRRRA